MKRRHLTKLQKVRIFDAHNGICHLCDVRIQVGESWECSHIISLWAGGTDNESNMAPAHTKKCHRNKTDEEATDRAKSTRMRANHLGISGPGKGDGQKFPAGRQSHQRKTFNHGIVERRSQIELYHETMKRRQIGGNE
jgi:5-methylcytosine-specific restriction enzyme A